MKFQQSISIDGFETGQTTTVQTSLGKKRRGGKKVRKRLENKNELTAKAKDYEIGGGQYPALQYSEEETERLLAEAYAGLPKKAGKRGTKHLQRESNRWHVIRKAAKVRKKNYGIRQHTRRMLKRSKVVRDVKQMKVDAVGIREHEAAYQQIVADEWTRIMLGGNDDDGAEGEQQESI